MGSATLTLPTLAARNIFRGNSMPEMWPKWLAGWKRGLLCWKRRTRHCGRDQALRVQPRVQDRDDAGEDNLNADAEQQKRGDAGDGLAA